MRSDFLKKIITSQASYVEYGYGQVEPNHLANQATKQTYGQLPAAANINVLENGQFAKYDYANGVVNFTGKGEWMLVYNEIKLYRDEYQLDCEFALVKDDYQARVYSPYGEDKPGYQSRFYNGKDADGNTSITIGGKTYKYVDVTKDTDPYEIDFTNDPFHRDAGYKEAMMPEGTTMIPRLIKTEVGDIITTNTINASELTVGATLKVGDDGILTEGEDDKMTWQVVKVYTMPDGQKGVKIMRIV